MFRKLALASCLSFGVLGGAHAAVILLGPVDLQGTGIGGQNTLLNVQSPGNSTTESGTVSWNGTTSIVSGSQIPGGTNNQTYTFGSVGINSAADLSVVLNINEPGNDGAIQLDSLVFRVYSPGGAEVWTGSLAAPVPLNQTQSGIGSAGYAFGLDGTQAAALQALWNPNLRFGISASLSGASGGYETFFLASRALVTPEPGPTAKVPEPGTLALLGLSMLGGLAAVRRRKNA